MSAAIQIRGYVSKAMVEVDALSLGLVNVDHKHNRIHRGQTFELPFIDTALASSGTLVLLFQLPAGVSAHVEFILSSEGTSRTEVFEGPTFSAAGTSQTPINVNRTSSLVSGITVTSAPTVSVNGTKVKDIVLASTSNGNGPGSSGSSSREIIMKPDEDYLIRMTNLSNQTGVFSLRPQWYEPALS